MKGIEVFEALLAGKSIKRTGWNTSLSKSGELIKNHIGEIYSIWFVVRQIMEYAEDWILVGEEKPELVLTIEDIGKRVRLRDGNITLLTGTRNKDEIYPYRSSFSCHTVNGKVFTDGSEFASDIMEILD